MKKETHTKEPKAPAANEEMDGAEIAAESETPATGAPAIAPEQIEELKGKAAKAEEYWDRLLRQTADFENFKKRAARERQDAIKYANETLLQKLIPVLDNLDMAQSAATADNTSPDSLRTGISMIYSQLKSALADAGLEEISAQGALFDPNLHEAVSQQESHDVPEGHVLQQMRKGYRLRDRLIRPATVIVAKKPAA